MFNRDKIDNSAYVRADSSKTYADAADEKSVFINTRANTLKRRIRDGDEEVEISCKQFASMRDELEQQTGTDQQQSSKATSLDDEGNELQPTGMNANPFLSNPFVSLSDDELIKKLKIAEQKSRFFKEKSAADGDLFYELNRILEYVAINAISKLSPCIIPSESVNEILEDNPHDYLKGLFDAQLFGQCDSSNCINFMTEGGSSSDPFLRFLHNTIQHTREFEDLQSCLLDNNWSEREISQELMSLICEYGLDDIQVSVINPINFNNPDISGEYEFNNPRALSECQFSHCDSKKLHASYQDSKSNYENSFGLWPFNRFVPIVVDSEGYPGYYLTGLFMNHFSDPHTVVKQMRIDGEEEVELERTQLEEALSLKVKCAI